MASASASATVRSAYAAPSACAFAASRSACASWRLRLASASTPSFVVSRLASARARRPEAALLDLGVTDVLRPQRGGLLLAFRRLLVGLRGGDAGEARDRRGVRRG